ncbi:putative Membrane protein insertase, YidC/Oxa1 family [uncultured delta proteobacterium]|uniref:Putative Membrane protein insertase, YidC/Oxa1 family n=1 Tax=uncultured delta proteobacterium TaxID=34034 RepID=A0A212IXL6_9DELT|nr:putative Membrane protein insertase, YidC/Oxa1 family [uncultured delta proteobacterium]
MPILDFLFYLCIAPLEAAMRHVLFAAHGLTGSWGASLVLLSLVVNIALIPVYHLAETWQEAERAVQRKMAPKLAEIQAVFAGRERWMFTRALYRLHGYSPIYSLRTSFGLLIQIPFFFAAYHLLHAAPEMAGASWLFLADLSRPDGLITLGGFSVNLMPFVMTGVNLLSAAVYTTRLTRREKIQLYGLAAVFLVLLYPSSAALLVYWTCNNIFSLGKNLVYTRFIYAAMDTVRTDTTRTDQGALTSREDAESPLPGKPVSVLLAWADIVCALAAGGLFAAAISQRKRTDVNALTLSLVGASLILAGIALMVRLAALRRGIDPRDNGLARHYGIFPLLVACIVALCVWKLTSFKKVADPLPWVFFRCYAVTIGLLAGWAVAREPFQRLFRRLAVYAEARFAVRPEARAQARFDAPVGTRKAGSLFAAAALVLAVLICWYTPAALYASDPDFFYESAGALAGRLTFRALVFLAACGLAFHWCHGRMKPFFALVLSWAALGALLFTFVATGDYGTMDEFVLQDPALLKTRLAFLVDLAVSLAAAGIIWFLLRRKTGSKNLTAILQGAAFALCLMALYQTATTPPSENTGLEQATSRLPDYNDELFGFTRTGTNTLVVMLDMFTGSHVERILAMSPELKQGLDGFVWYPDAMAPGATTLLSIGALLGGENYTAPAINARRQLPLKEELHKAFATLPDIFVPQGYSVALADVDELVPSLFEAMCPAAAKTLVVGKPVATAYTGYWREKQGLPSPLPESRAPFLGSVGLFRAAPWVLRDHIYFDGSWLGTQTVIHNPSEGPYAMLDVLPEVANADKKNSTVKYITSQVAHYPWRLDEATCMPVDRKGAYSVGKDRVIREHVVNERCGLLALARWFDWMKSAGVYDNTQIILVSDHDGNDSARFGKDFDDLRPGNMPWKPDALLLVKQRGSRGDLRIDNRPMSSADVVPLICGDGASCPGITYPDPLADMQTPRVRTHSAGLASIRRHGADHFKTRDYRVTGAMFDRKNWERLEAKP